MLHPAKSEMRKLLEISSLPHLSTYSQIDGENEERVRGAGKVKVE